MIFLPQLRDELVAVPPRQTTGRRRSFRIGLGALLAAPLITAGALAATGVIPIGSPLPQVSPTPSPDRYGGAPVGTSANLLTLRVADPAGGPPWGMRLVQTTRALTCVQVGRVVDGKLGVLGQDGVAGDDGRFHELPLLTDAPYCAVPDANGNTFLGASIATAASGPAPTPGCSVTDEHPTLKPCPSGDERRVLFGLLGPEATAITYRDQGKLHTQRVRAPEGAYLIVLASDLKSDQGSTGPMPAVGFTVQRIDYRNAPSCRGKRNHQPANCPLVGRASAPVPTGSLRRTVTATVEGDQLLLQFRAPVAIENARTRFTAIVAGKGCSQRVTPPAGAPTGPDGTVRTAERQGFITQSDRDYAAGDLVTIRSPTGGCRTSLTGTVRYITNTDERAPLNGKLIGHFTAKLP